jgi:hypothetical protein
MNPQIRVEPQWTSDKVVALEPYRRALAEAGVEADLNTEWDRLRKLADDAWTWRDPESLAELGSCVARLGLRSLKDWES